MFIKKFKKFYKSEKAATAIEYGLIAALISVAIIGSTSAFVDKTNDTFNCASNGMKGVFKNDGIGACKRYED